MRLAELTWKQAQEKINKDTLFIFPIGSVEQHGPTGPLGTDFFIPEDLCDRIEKRMDCMILPTMPFGVCPYHMNFPGSIDIGHDAMYAVINNVTKSLIRHGARRFLFLNGHGGNTPSIDRVCLHIYEAGGLAAQVDWWSLVWYFNDDWRGGHGDGEENSAVMAAHPEWVHLDEYETPVINHLSENLINSHINNITYKNAPVKIFRYVDAVAPTGEFGCWDSKKSDRKKGQDMMEAATDYIVDFCGEFKKAALPAPQCKCGGE